MGKFALWWFLSDISATRERIHTKFYVCKDNVCRRAPSPSGVHRPLGAGGEGVKNSKKIRVVSFVHRTATISILLSASKCGSVCRAQTCAHSDIEPSRSAKAILQGGPKSSLKNFEFFTISRLNVHTSQKRLKIESYKQRTEKRFMPPLSNCRMCMDPSLTGFYRVGQKLSDVIVLRITPGATEPSTVSVFFSVVKCGRICTAQTCAHSGIEPFRLAKGFPQGGPKSSKKFEFLTISKIYVPVSLQPL